MEFTSKLTLLAAVAAAAARGSEGAKQPHLIAVLADDLGFYDTGLYNPTSPTPTLAKLAKEGIVLDHHYVFRYCSPTRRSFLTGRFPTHVTTVQPDGANLCSDFLPLAAMILPEKLKEVGYISHFVGKGHLGYQTTDHLPINRGFSSHVGCVPLQPLNSSPILRSVFWYCAFTYEKTNARSLCALLTCCLGRPI
jgi:leishmanolysin-like peptidase